MSKLIRFNPYKNGCQGLRLLKEELISRGYTNTKEILVEGSKYRHNLNHLVINWGVPKINNYPNTLNKDSCNAVDKLKVLANIASFNPIFFTTSIQEARHWVNYGVVYCRTKLNASQGEDIVLARNKEELVEAPLYTLEIKPVVAEYRVHVFNNKIIDIVQKKKLSSERREELGVEINHLIRNHANGYIFAREGVEVSGQVKDIALSSLSTLNLNFGAVDVVWDGELAFVLEVNTAPGMEGTTVQKYADAIEEYIISEG